MTAFRTVGYCIRSMSLHHFTPSSRQHPFQPNSPGQLEGQLPPQGAWLVDDSQVTTVQPMAHTQPPSPSNPPQPPPLLRTQSDQLSLPLGEMRLNTTNRRSKAPAPMLSRSRRKPSASSSKRRSTSRAIRRPTLTPKAANVTYPPTVAAAEASGAIYLPTEDQYVIPLKNTRSTLLPAPPGSQLEVNDLLILHPPALSPNAKINPLNQYNGAGEIEIGDGYQSKFEMYTCRLCSKTYDGKNARSVARRHLQDKHGVPLSIQKRRSRWDGGESTYGRYHP